MQSNVKIPVAIQIRVDDVAWHNGADERHKHRPSRSGLPRKHHVLDYKILSEIGKALDMKIGCSLVIGEWDYKNRLRGVPHVTYDVKNWDMASQIDMDYAKACFEAMESSEYLDYTLHGLMHGYYDSDGKIVTEKQYYPFEYDEKTGDYIRLTGADQYDKAHPEKYMLSEEEFRQHIDLFLQIYNDWGFGKKIVSFASPCGCLGTPAQNTRYANILKEKGIHYWPNSWGWFDDSVGVAQGIICAKGFEVVTWNAYDVDPNLLPLGLTGTEEKPQTDFCFHWTNFIRFHPENNIERLDAWVNYFKRQAEVFGVMLAKDTPFAYSQALYNRFAKVEQTETGCTVDLTEVDSQGAIGLKNEFYISLKNGIAPKSVTGAACTVYETKNGFVTYKLERTSGNKIEIAF